MKKILLFPALLLLLSFAAKSQRLLTWAPEFPTDNTNLVITADCNKGSQGLLNFEGGMSTNVYVHVGVITNLSSGPSDWRYVKFPWGTATSAANATAIAPNKYQFTIPNVRTFFNVPAGETILKVNVIFRNTTGTLKQVNSDASDMYIPIYATGQYAVRLNLPPSEPRFVPWLEPINIAAGSVPVQAVASVASNLELKYNSTVLGTGTAVSTLSGTANFAGNTCEQAIIANGLLVATPATDSAKFFITPTVSTAPLPAGLQDGINYNSNTSVTLVLFAPNHTSVVAIGDFSNWQSQCAYNMTKTPDGNRYFITLTGLNPGQLYKFQYIVDGVIKTTDPYTELILDPSNDQFISAATFPNLPVYPANLTTGIVGTFQPGAPAYNWTTTGYTRPDKKSLVMYELHLRDFVAARNWQTLIDNLDYIKGLGVNAIELMPFNEFEGNNSWGYNPDFFFAPDKAYGTKNKLKEFIDLAHSKGLAVIMDAVLNHTTGLSPLAQMWWNSTTNQPTPNSPYLNTTATHPFSVFNDFNHESAATKAHTARYIRHWLTEYRLDGFRWDLSKGFTQKPCGSDVGCWNTYDATRVAIWQRYYDSSQVVSPGSYCILEHLGNDDEEGDLANRGMLLWGKMTTQYNQNTMGFSSNSDINRAFHGNRPFWSQPHLIAYAESHDEERLMYKNLTFGNNAVPTHDVRNLNIALSRMEAMQPFLLLIPGPKMIWQFGELGYDRSIFECENGTVPQPYGTDNCKTSPKPILWNYNAEPARKKIYNVIAGLNRIRALKPNAFITNTIGGNLGNDYKKQLIINHPDLQLVAISNFDVAAQNFTVTFPSAGTWYEYFTNNTFTASGSAQNINMQPGEYRVYTNVSFCTTAIPTVVSPVTYCQNATAAALTATGTNLKWYTTATGGTGSTTAPTPITTTVSSTTYYVSQTINGCESATRASIVVNVNALPAAPSVITPVTYCQNTTAIALTATGTNLLWYTSATGGTGSVTSPTPSTTSIGTTIYYVSQTISTCESPRAAITVNVTASTPAPVVTTPITYCQNATATSLTATGTSLLWYNAATGGTGSTTAPTPTTTSAGTTIYYVSQTTSCGEGPRAAISVTVNATPAAPVVTPTFTYCQNTTATTLAATGTGLLWYNAASGGTGTSTAPAPTTSSAGSTSYYVSQTVSGCESPRAVITVNVTATPTAPTVVTPVTFCQNSTAVALTATGSNLLWYTTATGGTGSSTAPTPSTTTIGGTTYYVSQTASTCEGPRAPIVVNVIVSTPAPVVTTPITYCQNATAVPVNATGVNLLWYTAATGGTGSTTAPTPTTTSAGTTTYYVSQTTSCGEGPRAAIIVTVNATPAAPTVTPTFAYCQNTSATTLTATGNGLLWYTAAIGGTGSTTAPTPSTTAAGSISYYVSQTINSCEGPRAVIVVNVTATPAAPTVVTPVTYCQNSTAIALTATGSNLLWYTTATGGTGSSTVPIPSTTTIGSTTYYVSQSANSCEGPRAAIVANVIASTPAPVVTTPITYCQNATATTLTATGAGLLWYAAATGGTGSVTAPTPNTTSAGTTIYYVSQTTSCGEGPRAAISVTVNATPAAPLVTPTFTYCQNTTAAVVNATGVNLLWYTAAVGGTGSSTAPTPNTTSAGSTSYYVSQTINGCEGPRAVITVNVTATPAAPTIVTPVTYCQNSTAIALTATGTNLLWYTTSTGGTGTVTAPIPSTTTVGSTTYYVSQTASTCEGPRAPIVVNVIASTPPPIAITPITYCQNATATALTATGTSLLWYNAPTGGSGSATAPTPTTTLAGTTIYYVSQTTSCGEGPRAAISVTVNATPAAPSASSNQTFCQTNSTVPLTAAGTNLLWYNSATGGTGTTIAPSHSISTPGVTSYYVSQSVNGCEGPRTQITITVTATPTAPVVTTPVAYCQNSTAIPVNATGVNLLWYTVANGGTANIVAPTPSTSTVGSFNFYASQTINSCESPRAVIVVNVVASPAAPTVTPALSYCQNTAATILSATGTNLLWYSNATGGIGSATAPTPTTTTAGVTNFYVSQSSTCGEGPRALIAITVNATPSAPTNLLTNNITNNSALLGWTGTTGSFYEVQFKQSTSTVWQTVASGLTVATTNLTGLTESTDYEWRVNANCSATPSTNYVSTTFTTTAKSVVFSNIENGFGLKVTPNPVKNNAKLDYLLPGSGIVNISLLNNNGQYVGKIFTGSQNAGKYDIDITKIVAPLAKGVYFIRIQQNGEGHSIRFVKY
jgi:nitrous oxide reductase accessory protein NosL